VHCDLPQPSVLGGKLFREATSFALSFELGHDHSGVVTEIVRREIQGFAVMPLHPSTHPLHRFIAIVAW
jgi:hypothetical protein